MALFIASRHSCHDLRFMRSWGKPVAWDASGESGRCRETVENHARLSDGVETNSRNACSMSAMALAQSPGLGCRNSRMLGYTRGITAVQQPPPVRRIVNQHPYRLAERPRQKVRDSGVNSDHQVKDWQPEPRYRQSRSVRPPNQRSATATSQLARRLSLFAGCKKLDARQDWRADSSPEVQSTAACHVCCGRPRPTPRPTRRVVADEALLSRAFNARYVGRIGKQILRRSRNRLQHRIKQPRQARPGADRCTH